VRLKRTREILFRELSNREIRIFLIFIARDCGLLSVLEKSVQQRKDQRAFPAINAHRLLCCMSRLLTGIPVREVSVKERKMLVASVGFLKRRLERYYRGRIWSGVQDIHILHPVYGKMYATPHAIDRFFECVSLELLVALARDRNVSRNIISCFCESLKRSRQKAFMEGRRAECSIGSARDAVKHLHDVWLDVWFAVTEKGETVVAVERPY